MPNNSNRNRTTTSRSGRSTATRSERSRSTPDSRVRSTRSRSDASSTSRRLDRTRRTPTRPNYTPRDRVSPTPRARTRTRSNNRSTRVGTRDFGATRGRATPNLVARTGVPRLGGLRSPSPLIGRARYGSFGRLGFNRIGTAGFCSSVWSGYWGWPRFSFYNRGWCNNWYGGWGLSSWGLNPFCWNYGLLNPYFAFRTRFWNNSFYDCHWRSWGYPYSVASTYWWYPSTTYCPTYLVTPGSTVYVEADEDEELVVIEEDPVDGSTTELVAAGGGVVGSARASDRKIESTLAMKYIELGDMYFLAGRYDDAVDAYSKARDHAPDDASIHFVLADAVFANGDYHYAAFLIGEAVRLDPKIVTAEADKREFYAVPAEFDRQLEMLQRYCAEKPYDAWARLVLGYNLNFSGQPVRAVAAFRRVLELTRTRAAAPGIPRWTPPRRTRRWPTPRSPTRPRQTPPPTWWKTSSRTSQWTVLPMWRTRRRTSRTSKIPLSSTQIRPQMWTHLWMSMRARSPRSSTSRSPAATSRRCSARSTTRGASTAGDGARTASRGHPTAPSRP